MRKIVFFMVLALLASTNVFSQIKTLDIDNIRHEGNNIYIGYSTKIDVTGVGLYISFDGGKTYNGPLKSVSGDINDVTAGKREIIWNFMEEYGNLQGDDIRFRISYNTVEFKDKWHISANVAMDLTPITSFGLTFGQIKKHGWFVSVMSNFNFKGMGTKITCDKDGFVDGGYPFYNGKVSYNRLSITGGALIRLSKYCFLKAGLGYGMRQVNWQTYSGKWIKNKGYSTAGVDIDAGVMFDLKNIVLSADAVTTNFKTFELKIGIGGAF